MSNDEKMVALGGYDSVLMIGSGAILNAWKPVFRALKPTTGLNLEISDPEVANLLLAKLVFSVRFFKDAKDAEEKKEPQKRRPEPEKRFNAAMKIITDFRERLAVELKFSIDNKEVELRKIPKNLNKYLGPDRALITTNWELDSFDHFFPVVAIPLHGGINRPGTLYLPGETSIDGVQATEDQKIYNQMAFTSITYLESTKKIILWGLGLNALDAELSVVFSEAFAIHKERNTHYKIIIFDICPEPIVRKLVSLGADPQSFVVEKVKKSFVEKIKFWSKRA